LTHSELCSDQAYTLMEKNPASAQALIQKIFWSPYSSLKSRGGLLDKVECLLLILQLECSVCTEGSSHLGRCSGCSKYNTQLASPGTTYPFNRMGQGMSQKNRGVSGSCEKGECSEEYPNQRVSIFSNCFWVQKKERSWKRLP